MRSLSLVSLAGAEADTVGALARAAGSFVLDRFARRSSERAAEAPLLGGRAGLRAALLDDGLDDCEDAAEDDDAPLLCAAPLATGSEVVRVRPFDDDGKAMLEPDARGEGAAEDSGGRTVLRADLMPLELRGERRGFLEEVAPAPPAEIDDRSSSIGGTLLRRSPPLFDDDRVRERCFEFLRLAVPPAASLLAFRDCRPDDFRDERKAPAIQCTQTQTRS